MSRSARLVAALVVNVALVVAQAVAGAFAHSTSLLSDAGHNLGDVAAIAFALIAVRWALRPRSATRSFGYHRGTILAALANAVLLLLVTAAVAVVSIERIVRPHHVDGGVIVVVAAAAVVANGAAALVLADRSSDLTMRSALVHMASDVAASLCVLVAGVIVIVAGNGWDRVDPIAALVVAVLIVVQALRLVMESADVLMESTPADVDLGALRQAITGAGGVSEVHDLHVWSLSSEVRALSAHLVLEGHPTLEEAQVVGGRVRAAVAAPFSIAHATFEMECERCVDADELADPCDVDDAGGAPAAGVRGASAASHTE